LKQLVELESADNAAIQLVVGVDPTAQSFHFLEGGLRLVLIVPETRVGHLGLEHAQASALAVDVKDTSAAPPAALRSASDRDRVHFPPFNRTPESLEDFLAGTQHFVQCFLEVGRALGQLLSHLRNILLEALFYLLSKELFQSSIAQAFSVLGGMVGNDVGD
jgi:hypothetical protein